MSAAAARVRREALLDGSPLNYPCVVDDNRESDGPGLVGHVDDPEVQHLVCFRVGLEIVDFGRTCGRSVVDSRPERWGAK